MFFKRWVSPFPFSNVGLCSFTPSDRLQDGLDYWWTVVSYDANWGFISQSEALVFELVSGTTYEDAEDGGTRRWRVYDKRPAGATIANVYDGAKSSNVIELKGESRKNGFWLNSNGARTGAWNNTTQKTISWDSQFSEFFIVYVTVNTPLGQRYLVYRPVNRDLGVRGPRGNYVHHGLGVGAKNGQWQTFSQDLEADLQQYEPGNSILSVNGFLVRGSGKLDNIWLGN